MKKLIAIACLTIAVVAVLAISVGSAFAGGPKAVCTGTVGNTLSGAAADVYAVVCPE